MRVMPANSTGWFWHSLARETGRIGHLYSPGDQRGPWPWFPYALDNACFSLWNPSDNTFNEDLWNSRGAHHWHHLLFWVGCQAQKPSWAIVPDRPGDWEATMKKWVPYSRFVEIAGIDLAVAVQDGATSESVKSLDPQPHVICVGGSTEWKWETAEDWIKNFPRVHVLRCNSPEKLYWLERLGCESTDGTGWNRGDRTQTRGIEKWARGLQKSHEHPLWPHVCRTQKDKKQMTFA